MHFVPAVAHWWLPPEMMAWCGSGIQQQAGTLWLHESLAKSTRLTMAKAASGAVQKKDRKNVLSLPLSALSAGQAVAERQVTERLWQHLISGPRGLGAWACYTHGSQEPRRSYVLSLSRRETGELAAGTSDGQVFILAHEGASRNLGPLGSVTVCQIASQAHPCPRRGASKFAARRGSLGKRSISQQPKIR